MRPVAIALLLLACSRSELESTGIPDAEVAWPVVDATRFAAPRKLAVAIDHVCAISADSTLWCWGHNDRHQLGDGGFADAAQPVAVALPERPISVAAGGVYSCALSGAGNVYCWGDLGAVSASVPTRVEGLSDVVVLRGGYDDVCAIERSGRLSCWGANEDGQLGAPASVRSTGTPLTVRGLREPVVHVETGEGHTCVLTLTHGVLCWGALNYAGEAFNSPHAPFGVTALFDTISAGSFVACGLDSSGAVTCFGAASDLLRSASSVPVNPAGLPGLKEPSAQVIVSGQSVCVRTESSRIICWTGELDPPVGAEVKGFPSDFAEIAEGATCARTASGAVWCRGPNQYGQLGVGWGIGSYLPVRVHGL